MIKDSGNRTEFETGAVRDMHEGKGDMASLPFAALLRLSKHYEAGAKKYGRWNYTKGILISSFMDSALRHIAKYMDGQDDEDHLAAAAFNILGAMEMEERKPEMQDIPARMKMEMAEATEEDSIERRTCYDCGHLKPINGTLFCTADEVTEHPETCPSYRRK